MMKNWVRICVFLLVTSAYSGIIFGQAREKIVVFFDFDRSEIRNDASTSIESLLASLNPAGSIKNIELRGHCDKIGSDEYNRDLSIRRARSVRDFLVNKGIDPGQITILEGLGENQPLNQNKDEIERAFNRRVEISFEPVLPATVTEQPKTEIKPEPQSLTKQLTDSTADVGTQIVLRNLNFQPGRHILLGMSLPILEELLQVMKDNPTLVIEIHGHVCCTGLADGVDLDLGTPDLSIQRAKAIYEYLIDNGIAASRLSYRGFGSTRRLYPYERNDFEMQQNRRVEIKIVKR